MKIGMMVCAWIVGSATAFAWIDYSDKVPRQAPAFGKEFAGFTLKIYSEKVEFEQEEPVRITIEIHNGTPRTTLLPQKDDAKGRRYALYLVLANKDGATLFSRNLLEKTADDFVAAGRIPPNAGTILLRVPFDSLRFARIEKYEYGMPYFDPKKPGVPSGALTPQLYTLKAILLSAKEKTRPDFVVASELWRILLLPKSVDRMTPAEKVAKMKKYLAKMSEGAYGGMGVSSQLAAFGDEVVAPLIEMADKKGGKEVRESRIWAIVTLCNTGSTKAEEYIIERFSDPVDFGDLAFLAWHSQGFHSKRVTAALSRLCEDVATGKPMPWEKTHGPESRAQGRAILEFAFKHFISIHHSITDKTAAGVIKLGDPKIAAFGLAAWKPGSPEVAIAVVKPLFLQRQVHGNLKKAVLNVLFQALGPAGFPKLDRKGNVNEQWLQAALWLGRKGKLTPAEVQDCLRNLVFAVRKENTDLQKKLIAALRGQFGKSFPVPRGRIVLPDHWVKTWRWALRTGKVGKKEAVAFLCAQMRTREAIPAVVRTALLLELRHFLGAAFPLKAKSAGAVNLETDWPTCGQWLVDHGYFGKKGK